MRRIAEIRTHLPNEVQKYAKKKGKHCQTRLRRAASQAPGLPANTCKHSNAHRLSVLYLNRHCEKPVIRMHSVTSGYAAAVF
jgi:hypothetical protein